MKVVLVLQKSEQFPSQDHHLHICNRFPNPLRKIITSMECSQCTYLLTARCWSWSLSKSASQKFESRYGEDTVLTQEPTSSINRLVKSSGMFSLQKPKLIPIKMCLQSKVICYVTAIITKNWLKVLPVFIIINKQWSPSISGITNITNIFRKRKRSFTSCAQLIPRNGHRVIFNC